MRAMTLTMLVLLASMAPSLQPAADAEDQVSNEPPAAQPVAQSAEEASAEAAEAEEEFRIPPGFRQKKRGKYLVYCRKEKSIGTRFETEKCYDEEGLREMVRAQQEDQTLIDQTRRICAGQGAVCGGT
jgi:hypothetical protein